MMLVVAAIVINWVVISYTHLKFKKQMIKMNAATQFPSIFYPFTNYLCIVFMGGILVIMSQTPDMRIAVLMIPVWISALSIAYFFQTKKVTANQLVSKDKMRSIPKAWFMYDTTKDIFMFQHVDTYTGDPILSLMEEFGKDERQQKVNLSIGLYYNEDSIVPQLNAVKTAYKKIEATNDKV